MNASKIGVTYVLTHPEFGSVKVGVTTYGSRRMRDLWRRQGWVPYKELHLVSKPLAETVEQNVLLQLRHRFNIPAHLTHDLMPEGWTETVSARLMSPDAVWELVCLEAGVLQMSPSVGAFKPTSHRPPSSYRRTKGDTPKYHPIARLLASQERRILPKTAKSTRPNAN
ncbi:GIY-YIG nuclease family protein [Streptomyces rubrogriseus]|uniref:GIY-YIG nuclease family protein n=1 Tax=Streptomyces rubrogriseus TaxID=194673 RepID=UPI000D59875D|nr:GIY-YIG nuclease family protein [Streptomyces rubrogriseus]